MHRRNRLARITFGRRMVGLVMVMSDEGGRIKVVNS